MIDLITASQDAIFTALSTGIDPALAAVFVVVPQGTEPNFVLIGALDSQQDLELEEQFEKITTEVQYIYRGDDRGVLIAMMHAGRAAIDQRILPAPEGVAFSIPRYVTGSVGTVAADGVTYAGIQTFTHYAQPA